MIYHIIFALVVLIFLLVLIIYSIKTSYEFAELNESFEEILIQLQHLHDQIQRDNI
jgi:uncharacterized membrane protein